MRLLPWCRPPCRVRLEGPACQVRLERPACRVRRTILDNPSRFFGHDKHAPPTLGETLLSGPLGGTCLSGPLHQVGLSIMVRRARRACPSNSSLGRTRSSSPRNPKLSSDACLTWQRHGLLRSGCSDQPDQVRQCRMPCHGRRLYAQSAVLL